MKTLFTIVVAAAMLSACTVRPSGTVQVGPIGVSYSGHKLNFGHVNKKYCHYHKKKSGHSHRHCHR